MPAPRQLIFLPGASGLAAFWQPVAQRLASPATQVLMGWPGFGTVPIEPHIHGLADLADQVAAKLDQPTALIAQSMGGIIAMQVALRRPALVTHLVLSVTSGGIDMADLHPENWREAFVRTHPAVPRWFIDDRTNLESHLHEVRVPTLLLWGDADPISPVAAGQRLQRLLPVSRLVVLPGGQHDLAQVHADEVATLIDQHIAGRPALGG